MISRELSAVTERLEAEKGAVVVFNPNGMRGDDVAAVEAEELEFGAGFVLVDGERELPVQSPRSSSRKKHPFTMIVVGLHMAISFRLSQTFFHFIPIKRR